MSDAIDFMNMEGLKFFGRVNASISHELKNILAIISETVGFSNDLIDLTEQGEKLKLPLFKSCNESIVEEIQRGFDTIKQMNKFAHSVDVPIKETDLLETLMLSIKLSSFLSFASHVQITSQGEETKSVLTCPFLLQNLIYQILIFIYKSIGPDGQINIQLNSKKNDGTQILFSCPTQLSLDGFPTQKIQKIIAILGVELNMNEFLNELDIWIPNDSKKIIVLEKELQMYSYTEKSDNESSKNS